MKRLINPFKNPSVIFLIKVVALYAVCNAFLNENPQLAAFNLILCKNIAASAAMFLHAIGFNSSSHNAYVTLNNFNAVFIGTPCNGFEFFTLFICFVLGYPSKIIHKIWFIPLGIFAIHLLNITRVAFLALNWLYFNGTFEFNHKYTFVMFVYGLLFLLWIQWAKRFALIHVESEA